MAFVRTHVKGYGRKQMHARVRTHTHKVHLATALWEASGLQCLVCYRQLGIIKQ